MQDGDGNIVSPPPHGYIPQYSHATDLGGGRRQRGNVNIRGILPTGVEIGVVSSVRLPDEVAQPGKTQIEFNVLEFEGQYYDPKGGPGASPTVRPLSGKNYGDMAEETQEDG